MVADSFYSGGIFYEYYELDGIITGTCSDGFVFSISANDGDWDLLVSGSDPVLDDWEDGMGHSVCSLVETKGDVLNWF